MKNIYKSILFLAIFLLGIQKQYAQINCGTDYLHQELLKNSNYKKLIESQNNTWKAYKETPQNAGISIEKQGKIYEIPLVFHIIHTGQALGTAYNPTDATIKSLVDYMNEAYAATWSKNPDTTNGGVFVPIRFILAKRDPDCKASTGINRIDASNITEYNANGIGMGGSSKGTPDVDIKDLSRWSPADYLNIWIVTNIQGAAANGGAVAGYATFPGTSYKSDGVVLRRDQTNWAIVHEVGHYLGLYHTFQGSSDSSTCPDNNDCTTDGDLVCDTDPHALVSGCPTGKNKCNNNSSWIPVVYNIMNYSSCPNRFTAGQKERMLFMLQNYRQGLITSLGLLDINTNNNVPSVPTTACVPSSIKNANNNYDIGPRVVALADLHYSSNGYTGDNDQFYIDNTTSTCLQNALVANLTPNTTYELTVGTGYNPEKVRAWIDYNNNGIFENSELIMSIDGKTGQSYETNKASFKVPSTGVVSCTSLRMRVASDFYGAADPTACNNLESGQTEDFIVMVGQLPAATIDINTATTKAVCFGTNITFNANINNGGNNPTYQWFQNKTAVGSNANSFNSTNIKNGDTIICKLIRTNPCTSFDTVISNFILPEILPNNMGPKITISANPNTKLKPNESVTFTLLDSNAGNSATYKWFNNGKNISGQTTKTYSTTTLTHGDVITALVKSSLECSSPDSAMSNALTMDLSAGILSQTEFGNLVLYPNPNNGNFIIKGDLNQANSLKIEVTNILGQKVFDGNLSQNNKHVQQEINLDNDLPNGVYILKLMNNEASQSIKFYIEK